MCGIHGATASRDHGPGGRHPDRHRCGSRVGGRLRREVGASPQILITASILDVAVLGALLVVKARTDMLVVYAAAAGILLIFVGERLFLRAKAEGAD